MSDSTEMVQYLEPWQLEVVLYVERVHSTTGALPDTNAIIEYLNFKGIPGVEPSEVESLKTNPLFIASMNSRGLNLEDHIITPKQMAAAAIMLNLTDRRSDEKKLRDIGVTTEEYSNWMLNTTFAKYMADRSENLVANSVHEAHMGLMRGVRQGNTASIKLYYEMTGRYNPNEENNVNIRMLIGRVLEAIQLHVRDPDTLNRLAVSLSQIAMEAGSGSPVAKNSLVAGESTRKEL